MSEGRAFEHLERLRDDDIPRDPDAERKAYPPHRHPPRAFPPEER
ncbi:hypothetical protein [Halomonas rhizosphaerae]|uniref:Uncharacterized protein n=1 Tax=Halomonas rhizosphaerae TaxID=3043296 RepID=A0ABT6UYS5_9GAMM|nr:hypothetical protein [Halomonas rhizosphaerae]MDI5891081.1 hypothetical protein [Halomonas rhizosphaerae]